MSKTHLRGSQQMMDGGFTNKGKTTVVPAIIIISLLAAANAKLCRFQRLDAILTVKTLAYPGHIRDKRATYNENDGKNILQDVLKQGVLTSFIEEFFKFFRGGEG